MSSKFLNIENLKSEQLKFEKKLKTALSLEVPYDDLVLRRMAERAEGVEREEVRKLEEREMMKRRKLQDDQLTPAAVLALFGYGVSPLYPALEYGPCILYTRRTDLVETHKGQMAFPGGHVEPEDEDDASTTALRETEEEVGISGEKIEVQGLLPSLVTATGYLIRPVVGILRDPIEQVSLKIDPMEIAETLWVPLSIMLERGTYRREKFRVGTLDYPIDVYLVHHYRIWGATGSMTKNLMDRLEAIP